MEIIQKLIPAGRPNRPGHRMEPKYITIHQTANPNKAADALAHARYLETTTKKTSWHFTVDDQRIVQHLPLNESGYHAGDGDGPGNRQSIGIEICENADGDRAKAEERTAELVAWLLRELNLPITEVTSHRYWSGKNCPHLLLPRWNGFIALVESKLRPGEGTPIVGPPQAKAEQAAAWARSRGATEEFVSLAPVYWVIGQQVGIRPEVAYAQAAKETAFGRFGGVIDASFHNWCGLKTREGGASSDPNAHQRFADNNQGVLAHIQHLAAYAGADIVGEIVDPRFYLVKKGSAGTVEELGGKWAPNPDYGKSIVEQYLKPLMATPVPEPQRGEPQLTLEQRVERLEKAVFGDGG
ncbi:MAG: N-acetylmuramoyl-L-alanine amidase [Syntrophomonadaceae bacterium]|nr:N-acetylmuramoyl-L-alanine amidase [Syntrophomonadaceae bacterium]